MKVSAGELIVLQELVDYVDSEANCRFFSGIAKSCELDVRYVRRACRSLSRKGLAEYVRGLFDEDGMIAGSGYCATLQGIEYIKCLPKMN